MRASKPLLFTAAALMAAGLAAGPATAQSWGGQPSVGEVVVEGQSPNGPSRISSAVPYDDLDLTMPEGRQVLWLRVRATANELCQTLGENPGARSPIVGSCRDDAMHSARGQVRAAIDRAYAQANLAYLDSRVTPY